MMRAPIRTAALLVTIAALTGCEEGVWVENTASATFAKQYSVRVAPGPGLEAVGQLNLDDIADVVDDIPDDAEIVSIEVTGIGGSYDVLSSTTSDSLALTYVLIDQAGAISPMAGRKVIDGRDPLLGFQIGIRKKFSIVPQSIIDQKLVELAAEMNRFMRARATADRNPRLGIGFILETYGGPFDADLWAEVAVQVRYRECKESAGAFITSTLEACVVGF